MQSEQATSLYSLIHSTNLSSDFEGFVEDVLRSISEELEVAIVSFWLYDEPEEKFFCTRAFDRSTNAFSRGQIISKKQQQKLYKSIIEMEVIKVSDIHADQIYDSGTGKFMSRGTQSWMNMLDHIEGKVFGFIRVDSTKQQEWDEHAHATLFTALSLINQSHYANNYELIDERARRKITKELASLKGLKEKISEYAFFTVHNIRHPLTNMISLMEMISEQDGDKKKKEELLELLKIEVLKLDEVVRVMIVKLELE